MNVPFSAAALARTQESDAVYRQMRSEIQFELNLVNARVNWLIASQAFLFMPLTIGAQGRTLADSLMYPLIPVLGVLICLLVLISIAAAVWRGWQWRVKACQGAYSGVEDHGTFSIIVPKTALIPCMGVVGSLGVPTVLAAAWIYLLVWPPS